MLHPKLLTDHISPLSIILFLGNTQKTTILAMQQCTTELKACKVTWVMVYQTVGRDIAVREVAQRFW
jgi:hypothetical protein